MATVEQLEQRLRDMAEEHEIGDQTYRFQKMNGLEAFNVWEDIRPGFSTVVDSVNVSGVVEKIGELAETPEAELAREGDRNAQAVLFGQVLDTILKMATAYPPKELATAKARLFRKVFWYNETRGQWDVVASNQELCFTNASVIEIYEVIGRAFWQNFQDSLLQLPVLGGLLGLILQERPEDDEVDDEALTVPSSLQTPPGSLSGSGEEVPDESPTSSEAPSKPS